MQNEIDPAVNRKQRNYHYRLRVPSVADTSRFSQLASTTALAGNMLTFIFGNEKFINLPKAQNQ